MPDGPITHEGLRVCSERCATCIFRPGNLMRLRRGRVAGMVREAIEADSFIPCHELLDGERAVCRGFFDKHGDKTLGCRIGIITRLIEVDPDTPHSGDASDGTPG